MSFLSHFSRKHDGLYQADEASRNSALQRDAQEQEAAERLLLGRATIAERFEALLGDRQAKTLSIAALKRLTLHRSGIEVGGVIVNDDLAAEDEIERTTVDVSEYQLVIVEHTFPQDKIPSKERKYRFLTSKDRQAYFDGNNSVSLTTEEAKTGIQKLEDICTQLGDFCLSNAQ